MRSVLSSLEAEKIRIESLPPPDNVPSQNLLAQISSVTFEITTGQSLVTEKNTILTDRQKERDKIKGQIAALKPDIPAPLQKKMADAIEAVHLSEYSELLYSNELSQTKLDLQAANLQKVAVEKIPDKKEMDIWCADFSTDLSGDFGTIDIPGEIGQIPIQLKPAFEGSSHYEPVADGDLVNLEMMSPESTWFNLAVLPYLNKWKPKYRRGHITGTVGDLFTVELEETSTKYNAISVTPEKKGILLNVPATYMECNAAAFQVGDFIIVEFIDRDLEKPKIIGFASDPRPCSGIICFPASKAHPNGWGKPFTAGTPPVEINSPLGSLQEVKSTSGVSLISSDKSVASSILKVSSRGGLVKVGNIAEWTSNDVVTFMGPPSGWVYAEDKFNGYSALGFRGRNILPASAAAVLPSTYSTNAVFSKGRTIIAPGQVLTAKLINKTRLYVLLTDNACAYLSIQYTEDNGKTWVETARVDDPRSDANISGEKYSSVSPPKIADLLNGGGDLYLYSIPSFNLDCSAVSFIMVANLIPDSSTPVPIDYPFFPGYRFYEFTNVQSITPDLQKYLAFFSIQGLRVTRYDADQGSSCNDYTEPMGIPHREMLFRTKSPDFCYYDENGTLEYVYTTTESLQTLYPWARPDAEMRDILVRKLIMKNGEVSLIQKNGVASFNIDGNVHYTLWGVYSESSLLYLDARNGVALYTVPEHREGLTAISANAFDAELRFWEKDYVLQIGNTVVKVVHSNATQLTGITNLLTSGCAIDHRSGTIVFSSEIGVKARQGSSVLTSDLSSLNWISNGDLDSITGVSLGAPGETDFTYFPTNVF
jgi:hypothetical protein